MNIPQGPWYIDDLLTFTVTTHRFDTGALTDADAVPAYRVYEDETGTAILTGNMAKLDDANTTGFYSEQITLSAANGFELGKSYNVYVTATVNSVAGGQSGGFKVIATPVAQTGDSFARLGAPAGASVSADIAAVKAQTAAIETDTQDIQSRIPAALVSGRMDSHVGAMANNVLTAAAINADAITAAKLAADVTTELQNGLATASALSTLDGKADSILADTNELQTDWANGGRLDNILDARASQTSVDDLPTNAELATALGTADDAVLAAIAALSIPTANQNADALLDRAAGVETNRTLRQAMRLILAAAAGKASGLDTTTATYRDTNDSKDRIVATVDEFGNRSAVTLDAS